MKRELANELIKKVLPSYEIVEMIGEGSCGAVFRIRDSLKERAVKIIELSAASSIDKGSVSSGNVRIERDFRYIVESYEKVACDEIVTVYDFHRVPVSVDSDHATTYALVVMEIYPYNLHQYELDYFRRYNRLLDIEIVKSLMEKLAGLLNTLYTKRGFLFEDLKPANLLIKDQDRDLKLVVGDIGGLRKLGSVNIIESQITLAYSAPEVIRKGQRPDIRSIIYSYGLISCFMLEGHLPYEESKITERFDLIKEKGLIFDRKDVPDDLSRIIRTCLAFEADDRYQTFDEIVNAIHGKVKDEDFIGQTIDLESLVKGIPPTAGARRPADSFPAGKRPFGPLTPRGALSGAGVSQRRSPDERNSLIREQGDVEKVKNEIGSLVIRSGDSYKIQDQDCKVLGNINVESGGTLIIENAKLFFEESVGIVSSGVFRAKNALFSSVDVSKKWANIALNLLGANMSVIEGCKFRFAGGRSWQAMREVLHMRNYPLNDNYAYGGALFIAEAKERLLIIDDCSFNNCSSHEGGAIFCLKANPTISRCVFEKCSAALAGGGVSCLESNPVVRICKLHSCVASKEGGGMYCRSSNPVIEGCTFDNCVTKYQYGGGIFCSASSPTIKDCRFNLCISSKEGGAVYADISSKPRLLFPSFTNCRPNNTNFGVQ